MEKKNLIRVHDFLKEAQTYYLATADGDQPRVRPFGTILLFENKLYILTSKTKDISKQVAGNSKFELSAMDSKGNWIRVNGNLIEDNRKEVQIAMLEEYPNLKNSYSAGGENTQTLYLDNAIATIYSFEKEPEVLGL
ncbi:MAG: pyridoxamine 5'-phosphate oxidase family protein [Lachnospiraceae bacterium]|nr:pyridoxamine 5'-phosphate oxidase family protein [Lachnospiraceae bacterium]